MENHKVTRDTLHHASLRHASEALASVSRALGLAGVAEEIESETRRRIANEELRVVVLGEIKHGKSSLINALLGASILPMGVTPTTAAVVTVRAGDEVGRYEADEHGAREPVDEERFAALARGKAESGGMAEAVIGRGGALPDGVLLVDTPGLNDIARFRGAISRSMLPRADVLVLVLDATQALTRTELALLHDALAAVGGLGQSGARLELVINRIDLVPEDDRPTIVAHIREQLGELLPAESAPFLTDAKSALKSPDSDAPPVRAVAELRARLAHLAASRDEILPARVRSSLLRQVRLLRYSAAIQTRALQLESDALRREIAAVRESLSGRTLDLQALRGTIDQGRREILEACQARISTFSERLQTRTLAEVDKADLRSLTDVLPGAVQDAVIEFARAEATRLREALEQLTAAVMHTHGEQARRRLFEATLRLGFAGPAFYVEPPSILIEAGLVVLGVVGTAIIYLGNTVTGLIMTIASPLTTMILREKSVRDARAQAKTLIPPALDETGRGLHRAIEEVVVRYVDELEDHLTIASASLGEQLEGLLARARDRLAQIGEATPPTAGSAAPDVGATTDREVAGAEASEVEAAEVEAAPTAAARRTALSELAGLVERIHEVADALEAIDLSGAAERPTEADPIEATGPGDHAETVTESRDVETTGESEG